MSTIYRKLQSRVESWLFKDKILIILGARQVGKTTLCKNLLAKHQQSANYFLCENPTVREILLTKNTTTIKNFINPNNSKNNLVIFDEAQYIEDIGLILKLLHDQYPELQIIATGSSSFDLSNKLNEPLTGRAIQFTMYPLALSELLTDESNIALQEKLDDFLRFGLYPAVYNSPSNIKEELLINLSGQYLYKDILQFESIKNSNKITMLLKLLALQIGNEVSINELATQLGFSRTTVENFLNLLEKMFIILKLPSFSRNLRKELSKKSKYYFYDLGIRNAILNAFNALDMRSDAGGLWENFCIMERIKFLHNSGKYPNFYFWRTHDQHEIDYLEEKDQFFTCFEFKFNSKKFTPPKDFINAYPNNTINVITKLTWPQLLK